ncbi:hypothetical protein OHA21_14345 [Actinoplanes sp. NBC_00393]|uniref:hypothetical protein n=1 Tax=Actinoplanes sp. NBC_00393 TaxID=2975953 RepID=UPI002E1BAB81
MLLVALLAGCATEQYRLEELTPATQAAADDVPEQQKLQARAALARYGAAVGAAGKQPRFVPVGEQTAQIGDGEAANGAFKRSLLAGKVVATRKLPAAPRRTGEVVWDGGATLSLPLISAEQALHEVVTAHPQECADCVPLRVVAARLTTAAVLTTRGEATVPAWEFTLKGTAVRITHPAVAAGLKVTPPSWDPYDAPGGLAIDGARTTVGSRELTVSFTGSVGPASEPCGADYTGRAVESEFAVVVIVVARPHAAGEACRAIGAPRTATVTLDQPLGERAVLEVMQGLPVPVRITA